MKHWITKDGKRILIKDMTTQHLENTIKMLDRQHARNIDAALAAAAMFDSDSMAAYYAEQEVNELTHANQHPLYNDLLAELKKRK